MSDMAFTAEQLQAHNDVATSIAQENVDSDKVGIALPVIIAIISGALPIIGKLMSLCGGSPASLRTKRTAPGVIRRSVRQSAREQGHKLREWQVAELAEAIHAKANATSEDEVNAMFARPE